MAQDKISMPSSGAGLTRYFDDYKSKISLKPEIIIVFIVILVILVLLLNAFGASWFGVK
jgi:preprotein translocase subunit Sec61beta